MRKASTQGSLVSFHVICTGSVKRRDLTQAPSNEISDIGTLMYILLYYPPAPRCGDSDQGGYVGEWMVPRCYGIDDSEKGLLITKRIVGFRRRFNIFEKAGGVSRLPNSYFLYVAVIPAPGCGGKLTVLKKACSSQKN